MEQGGAGGSWVDGAGWTWMHGLVIPMSITKPCTQLHAAPSTSLHLHPAPSTCTHLILTSTQLFPPPTSPFQPPPALCSALNNIETKYRTCLGNFPKYKSQNSKLSILNENWLTRYLGGADSESRLRFLKFRSPKFIFGQIWAQKNKVVCFV